MEKHYTAYTKEIDGEKFHFVKEFISFPELGMTAQMLNKYGMHKDFIGACETAGITDPVVKEKLNDQIQDHMQRAVVIDINNALQSKRRTL